MTRAADSFVLFTYGSLMFAPVWERVTGLGYSPLPGRLTGYSRVRVANETYPALVTNSSSFVDGAVHFDVSPEIIATLDEFEGDAYVRIPANVTLSSADQADSVVFPAADWSKAGTVIEAQVYRFVDHTILTGESWSSANFAVEGMAAFMAHHVGLDKS